jgi:iron complex transport system substrate-binding protein
MVLAAGTFLFTGQVNARQVTDGIGRTMDVPENPVRVVAMAPSITEVIYALGEERRLVGISQFSDFPPKAASLPRVGSYIRPDLERIIALNPDLCIAVKDGNPRSVAERLESFRIPVFAVDPRNLDAIMNMVVLIGRLLHAPDRAMTIADAMQARIQDVRDRVAKTRERPRVFFQIGISPIVSIGSNTFIHELIEMAGGTNLCAEFTVSYPRLSREQVVALAPDVLIMTTMDRNMESGQVAMEWKNWTQIPAIRNSRIAVVDSNVFDRPTPRQVDALEELVRLIHPELYQDNS